jgi:hypothetical protein
MRLILSFLLLSMVGYVGCSDAGGEGPAVKPIVLNYDADGKAIMEVKVPELHCEHCAASAVALLQDMDGVSTVNADVETKTVTLDVQEGKGFVPEKALDSLEGQFGEVMYVEQGAKS